ncbi:hypothetical protein L873DRAFT_793450 [Choiromyces venosus 120613-1]|uniref:Uncharacterized protein n=1 Tax=Choiromyces venosus 120613-1 TaxID=1336337 RepID=A0A3N4K4H7_9PEZI|nr:hypothetical protein L873DRAFT_793450 [Choiromyces venosus 120613-1]
MIFSLPLFSLSVVLQSPLADAHGMNGSSGRTSILPVATTVIGGFTTTTLFRPKPTTSKVSGIPLPAGVGCLDSSWIPTVDAWVKEKVDQNLKEWWGTIKNRNTTNFVTEFGKAFGDSAHNLACGVDTEDQCINPSCTGLISFFHLISSHLVFLSFCPFILIVFLLVVFRDAKAPKWTYFVRVAISNLNRFMRLLHAGIGEGQLGFEALREDVAQTFFPWKDTRTDLEKEAPWLSAMVSAAAGFVPFGFALKGVIGPVIQPAVSAVSETAAAFAGAAFAQVGLDPAIKPIIERVRLLSEMGKFVADYCFTARDILGKWSAAIFKGDKDRSGNDILVYLRGGRFVLQDNWTKSDLETFFKKRLVAWFVNNEIREHTKTFVLCANSTDIESIILPLEPRYITNNGTRVCSLYRYYLPLTFPFLSFLHGLT